MSEVAYIVKLTTAPGKRDEALTSLGKLVDATESEPGTLTYARHADAANEDVIWFYEVYADQAAFEAHSGSPTMAEVGGSLGGLLGGMPEMNRVEFVRRKGGEG